MAISSIFNTLTFGSINSGDYGIYITGEAVYNAPQRAVNMVTVPGRNGAVAIDQGRWENINVTYPAGTFGDDQSDFSEKVSAFRNAIMSLRGYQRLTDSYHPDEYRMGLFMEAFEVEPVGYSEAGQFSITFNCKPQRWLTSGETAVTVADGDTLTNPTLFASSPIFKINGYGTVGFGEYEIEITNKALGYYELPSNSIAPVVAGRSYEIDLSAFETGDAANLSVNHSVLASCTNGFPTNSQGIGVSDPSTYYNRASAAVTSAKELSLESTGTLPITVGTDATFSNVVAVTFISGAIRPTIRITETVTYTASTGIVSETAVVTSYDSTYFSGATITSDQFSLPNVSGISSKSILGNVVIDCDLGIAYKDEDGKIVDLNGYIDLGSDLPLIEPGQTTITADNTITSIEITPRWWRL